MLSAEAQQNWHLAHSDHPFLCPLPFLAPACVQLHPAFNLYEITILDFMYNSNYKVLPSVQDSFHLNMFSFLFYSYFFKFFFYLFSLFIPHFQQLHHQDNHTHTQRQTLWALFWEGVSYCSFFFSLPCTASYLQFILALEGLLSFWISPKIKTLVTIAALPSNL